MADILHRIGIRAPVSRVQAALASIDGLAGWWTADTVGESRVGGEIVFSFKTPAGDVMGVMTLRVDALEDHSVRWTCLAGPEEWVGTRFTFDLSEQDGQTILLFGHRDWREAVEFTAHCSMKWATFLLSLRALVETGSGQPSPRDLKIDNWN